jgi:hypothetical protein
MALDEPGRRLPDSGGHRRMGVDARGRVRRFRRRAGSDLFVNADRLLEIALGVALAPTLVLEQ